MNLGPYLTHFPNAGITSMLHHSWLIKKVWVLGLDLGPSYLQDKHFPCRAIAQSPTEHIWNVRFLKCEVWFLGSFFFLVSLIHFYFSHILLFPQLAWRAVHSRLRTALSQQSNTLITLLLPRTPFDRCQLGLSGWLLVFSFFFFFMFLFSTLSCLEVGLNADIPLCLTRDNYQRNA